MTSHNIHFHYKIKNFPKISFIFGFFSYRKKFPGIKKEIKISHGKQDIDVRVLLYFDKKKKKCAHINSLTGTTLFYSHLVKIAITLQSLGKF